MQYLQQIIETAFENRFTLSSKNVDNKIRESIEYVINALDSGTLRVSEKIKDNWITHQWIKKAILLSFCIFENNLIYGIQSNFFDKLPMKFFKWNNCDFQSKKIRVVPPASVRKGAYIARNTILMPSYINIGAYVDEGSMIDTWATIGSCAQIGKNVHISGGAGIGGVLEPWQMNPTIIEDNCFIGARSEIVEGVIIKEGSVISMGVFIGQSTKIYDRETGEIIYGHVPSKSVVVSGSLPSKNHCCNIYCAVIVKKVDNRTCEKTQINNILRT